MNRRDPAPRAGMTLLELLLATAVAAVVILATLGLWQAGLRDRREGFAQADARRRVARLRERMRADLANAIYTGQALGAGFVTAERGENARLEWTTTGDRRPDGEPGSDIAQVEYWIAGGELRRAVRRDLLATVREELEGTPLLDGVASLEADFFDGTEWREDWGSDVQGGLPRAVTVRLRWTETAGTSARPPCEFTVPVADAAAAGDGA